MVALPLPDELPSDAELIAAARAGNDDAYGQLYARHVGAARAAARSLTRSRSLADDLVGDGFTRVLAALRNGGGPEVAFRPYLLASIRTAFYDRTRKDRRVEVTDDVEAVAGAGALELFDPRISLDERHLVAKAFASLPERWQLVLWHTEVEGRSPAEVAPLLGLAPNAVAALAYRAREGLRKAYLQAHLQLAPADACRYTVERLGAYVRDGVSPREREAMDEHLARCDSCTAMLVELRDVDSTLRRALVPLVLGVGPAVYLKAVGASAGGRGKSRSTTQMGVAAALVAALVAAGVAANADNDPPDEIAAVASTTSTTGNGSTTTTISRPPTTLSGSGSSSQPQSITPVGSATAPQTIPVVNAPVPGATIPTTASRPTTTTGRTTTTVRRTTPTTSRRTTPTTTRRTTTTTSSTTTTTTTPPSDETTTTTVLEIPGPTDPPAPPSSDPSEAVLTFASAPTLGGLGGLVVRGQPATLTVPINRARDAAPEDLVVKLRGATLPGGGLVQARQAARPEAFVSIACIGAPGSDEWRCPTASLPVGENQVTFDLTVNGDLGPDDTVSGQVRIEASNPRNRSSRVIPTTPVDPIAVSATGALVEDRAVVTVEVVNQSATREIPADELVVSTEAGAPLGARQIPAVPPGGKVVESFEVGISELASVGVKLGARPWHRVAAPSGGAGFRVVVTSNLATAGAEAVAATLIWQGEGAPTASRAGAPVELEINRAGDGSAATSWLDLGALYESPGLELVPPAGAHVAAVVPGGPLLHFSGALRFEDLGREFNVSGGGSAEVIAVGRNLVGALALSIDGVSCAMAVEAAAPATVVRGTQCPAADDGGGADSLTGTITGDDAELGVLLVLRAGLPTQPG